MLSALKYRLYPTGKQELRFKRSLQALCFLYNLLRATKISEHAQNGRSLNLTDLRALALTERRTNPDLLQTHSQATQNVADRVYASFQNYFEGRARFPKAKQPRKYRSLTYPQSGFSLEPTQHGPRLHISKVGKVRIFLHRPIEGTIQRLTIKYEAGEWYAIFTVEKTVAEKLQPQHVFDGRIRGGDLGLETFLTLDNTETANYPEFLRRAGEKIKRLQRRLSHKKRGSRRYRRLAFQLARLHLHVKRQREDWQNKTISTTFKECDILVLEKLHVENMLRNHCLAKSVADAAWAQFASKTLHKADLLSKRVMFVDAWGTSQFCHNCLTWVPKTLMDREHKCPQCGTELPRDQNSARLIKKVLVQYLRKLEAPSDGGLSPAEPEPLPSLRALASKGVEAGSPRL